MTAGMIGSGRLRRVLLGTTAATALTAGLVGAAPAAVAADVRSQQWYLDAMRAEEIWKKSTGKGIKVAVIDSGVNPNTPSLKGKVLKGWDATGTRGDETDDYTGHGTTMAELIVGSGANGGIRGLAPDAEVIPYRVSDTERQHEQGINAFDMEESIKAAANSDARIINISWASDYANPSNKEAVEYAVAKGKLIFAGAGNNAKKGNKPQYPAAFPDVVAVAAIDRNSVVADYSQHGEHIDLAAPGSDIPGWCDEKFEDYCTEGGTSNATAIASASAALIWSMHPDWTANQVLRVMFESAARDDDWQPGSVSSYLGHGLVRPNAHISRNVGKPGDPNISPLTNKRTDGGAPGSTPSPGTSAPSAAPSSAGSPAPSASDLTQAPDGRPTSDAVVAGSSGSAEDGGRTGLVIGAVAAVAVVAVVGFVLVRRRHTT
ncbi:S8 family serine peptidase [Streptomyces sp. NPDC012825]|uniref:S8 family serine peptidase n=1 Tax=Streptomyces sp. NPDC012825 TaxID=3364851 RepID=UPI00368C45EB